MKKSCVNRKAEERNTAFLNGTVDKLLAGNGYFVFREKEKDGQIRGIDLYLFPNGSDDILLVDEKAAVEYWDRDLETYSIEFFTSNNVKNQGWFVNDISETTHYLFLCPRSLTADMRDVYSLEGILVEKKKLKDYFRQHGIFGADDVKRLLDFKGMYSDGKKECYSQSGLKIVQSLNKKEMPINVLVPKKDLLKMAVDTVFFNDLEETTKEAM